MKDISSQEDAENHISHNTSAILEDVVATQDSHEEPDRAELNELKDVFARFF